MDLQALLLFGLTCRRRRQKGEKKFFGDTPTPRQRALPSALRQRALSSALPGEVILVAEREYCHECFLGNLYVTYHFETFFAFFLFLQKFAFARNIATIAFGEYIFTHGFDCFASDDARTDCCLYWYLKKLPWYESTQFLDQLTAL